MTKVRWLGFTYSTRPDAEGMIFMRRGIHCGRSRPTRHAAPKATFSTNTLSRTSFHRGMPAAGASVRLLRLVSAHAVWGTT